MAVNILGTTSSKGLGANRKSSTPRFSGTNTGLNTGGSREGVSLSTGRLSLGAGGSVRAPTVSARNITPFIQQTPNATGPLVSDKAVSQGMTALANSVEQYTDHVEELRAKEAIQVLNSRLSTLFYGDDETEGFRSTEGFEAVDGYKTFSSQVDQTVKEVLEGLNPYARQKAVMAAFAKRDTYLNTASSHTVDQKNKLDIASRKQERSDILRDVITDPRVAMGQFVEDDKGNKIYQTSAVKQQYYSTFKPHQIDQAEKGWNALLGSAAERIYLDGRGRVNERGEFQDGTGVMDAQVFRQTVGATEMSKEALLDLDKKIFNWDQKEKSAYLQSENLKEAREAKARTVGQATNFSNMVVDHLNPEATGLTQYEASLHMQAGNISPSQFRSYKAMISADSKTKVNRETDKPLYAQLLKQVSDLSDSHSLVTDSLTMSEQILGVREKLSDTDFRYLMKEVETNKDKKKAANRKDAIKAIDVAISDTYNVTRDVYGKETRFRTDTSTRLEYDALKEYRILIDEDTPHSQAVNSITKKYSDKDFIFSNMPFIPGYGKPSTMSEFNVINRKLKEDAKAGKLTESEFSEAGAKLMEYRSYIANNSNARMKASNSPTVSSGNTSGRR